MEISNATSVITVSLRATKGSAAISPVPPVLLRDCFVAMLLAKTRYLMGVYQLTFAEAARIALLAALLVDERRETAVGAHIARLQGGLAARR